MLQIKHGHKWGNWQFDEKKLYLDHLPTDYNISLNPMNLVLQLFTSIRQIRAKTWSSSIELGNLLQAYADVFESSHKFQKAFQTEIAPKKPQWETFRKETAALIEMSLKTSDWNLRLEEIYKKFCA